MASLVALCDRCGIEIRGEEIYSAYDGIDHCRKCKIETDLIHLETEIKNKQSWLDSTHLKELNEMKGEVEILKKQLEELNQAQNSI